MAAQNRHQQINCNISGGLTIDSTPVSEFTNYELAYHHHLQTALQMGQFYTPEQLGHSSAAAAAAAAAAALRSSASSSSIVSSGSLRLVDGGGGTPTQNNCHSIWDSRVGQRGSMGYHHPHGATDLLSVTSALQCDLWPTTHSASITNGRLPNSGHPQRFGGPKSSTKKPRRRVATIAQRRAANIRERRRMFNLNEAFDKLRRKVPTFAYEKRLSRIETLRLAITYISFMRDLLIVPDPIKSTGPTERVGKINQSHQNNNGPVNHSHCQYIANNNNANGVVGMDCLQNQNVPPPMSPFNPMGRLYSPHLHPSTAYLPSGVPQ